MKKLPKNEVKNNIAFRISKNDHTRLKKLSKKLKITFSELIRKSLEKYENTL